jgi:hypothetical protein
MLKRIKNALAVRKASIRRNARKAKLGIESLEARQLLSFGSLFATPPSVLQATLSAPTSSPLQVATAVGIQDQIIHPPATNPAFSTPASANSSVIGLLTAGFDPNGLPRLESNPGATRTLYLDFTGLTVSGVLPDNNSYWASGDAYAADHGPNASPFESHASSWNGYQVPAFDLDGDLSTFSQQEQTFIRNVWAYVADAYAPFDVNVSTVSHANPALPAFQSVVAIGGFDPSYNPYGAEAGIMLRSDGQGGEALVFDKTIAGGFHSFEFLSDGVAYSLAKEVAHNVIHESGHIYGLQHYSVTVQSADWYPTMEDYYSPTDNPDSKRESWYAGDAFAGDESLPKGFKWPENASASTLPWVPPPTGYQDDIKQLAHLLGFRQDDNNESPDTATALSADDSGQYHFSGVIGLHGDKNLGMDATPDVDWYSFQSGSGLADISVSTPSELCGFGNLRAHVEVWSAGVPGGPMVRLGETDMNSAGFADLKVNLNAGIYGSATYYVRITSTGGYANLGDYNLTVAAPRTGISKIFTAGMEVGILPGGNADQGYAPGSAMLLYSDFLPAQPQSFVASDAAPAPSSDDQLAIAVVPAAEGDVAQAAADGLVSDLPVVDTAAPDLAVAEVTQTPDQAAASTPAPEAITAPVATGAPAASVTDLTNVGFTVFSDDGSVSHQLVIQSQAAQVDGSATFTGIWDPATGGGVAVTGTLAYDTLGNIHLTFVAADGSSFDSTVSGQPGTYHLDGILSPADGSAPVHLAGDQDQPPLVASPPVAAATPVADLTNVSFTVISDDGTVSHQLVIQSEAAQADGSGTFTGIWDPANADGGQAVTGTLAYDAVGNIHLTFVAADGSSFDSSQAGAYHLDGTLTPADGSAPVHLAGDQDQPPQVAVAATSADAMAAPVATDPQADSAGLQSLDYLFNTTWSPAIV